jgi:hypothetical protein
MKTAFYLFLLAALPMFANTVETVVISGKVTNTSDNKLAIRGESFLKEISLKPDGSFSETLISHTTVPIRLPQGKQVVSLPRQRH